MDSASPIGTSSWSSSLVSITAGSGALSFVSSSMSISMLLPLDFSTSFLSSFMRNKLRKCTSLMFEICPDFDWNWTHLYLVRTNKLDSLAQEVLIRLFYLGQSHLFWKTVCLNTMYHDNLCLVLLKTS